MRKYQVRPIEGTSSADHLNYEVTLLLRRDGYGSRAAAKRAWHAACSRADARRARQGYVRIDRPRAEVIQIETL